MHTRSMFASWWLLAAALASPCVSAAMHDVDGNGRDDVFWRNTSTGANVLWLAGDAAHQRSLPAANTRWAVVGFGDFDGDGFADLLWRQRSTGANTMWRGGNPATQQTVTATNLAWFVAAVGDFDGDGRADILWRNRGTGANVVWHAAQSAMALAMPTASLNYVVAGTGDFDGDGGDDIAWRNTATGGNVAWLSNGGRMALTTVGDVHWQVAGVGDFDGDGRADLLWHHVWDGRNAIWRGGQSTSQMQAPILANWWQQDVAAIGDFDGDGRADVLWRDYDTGRNTVWHAGSAAAASSLATVTNQAWTIVPYDAQATQPLVTFDNANVAEGNTGARPMSLRARLAHPSVVPVHLSLQFDDLMAADGATRQDDFGTSRQVQDVAIQPGEDIAATTLWIVGDTTPEANERINAQVIDAPAARFLRHPAIVIANDDANTIWVDNSSASEGDTGMHPMPFTIHLSRPQPFPVRFNIATFDVDGLGYFNATAGQDYVPRASALTIPAGATSTTFNVQIIGDTAQEYYAEEFAVRIESVTQGAVLVDVAARGRIFDFTEGLP